MCKDRLFKYRLLDAWFVTISEVEVFQGSETPNVRCIRNEEIQNPEYITKTFTCMIDIPQKDIEQISKLINDNLEIVKLNEVEFPQVLDGWCNAFNFLMEDGSSNELRAANLWAFRENANVRIFEKPPYKATELLSLYDQICKILIQDGVDSKFLSLDNNQTV